MIVLGSTVLLLLFNLVKLLLLYCVVLAKVSLTLDVDMGLDFLPTKS